MGLYDRLVFEDGFDLEFPGLATDPTTVTWQTKSIHRPMMDRYKVTSEGRLYKELAHYEVTSGESDDDSVREILPRRRRVHRGWTDVDYHGIVEFHTSLEGCYVSYEARFTEGTLVELTRNTVG